MKHPKNTIHSTVQLNCRSNSQSQGRSPPVSPCPSIKERERERVSAYHVTCLQLWYNWKLCVERQHCIDHAFGKMRVETYWIGIILLLSIISLGAGKKLSLSWSRMKPFTILFYSILTENAINIAIHGIFPFLHFCIILHFELFSVILSLEWVTLNI